MKTLSFDERISALRDRLIGYGLALEIVEYAIDLVIESGCNPDLF